MGMGLFRSFKNDFKLIMKIKMIFPVRCFTCNKGYWK